MSKCAELARQRLESNGEKVLIHAKAFLDGCRPVWEWSRVRRRREKPLRPASVSSERQFRLIYIRLRSIIHPHRGCETPCDVEAVVAQRRQRAPEDDAAPRKSSRSVCRDGGPAGVYCMNLEFVRVGV